MLKRIAVLCCCAVLIGARPSLAQEPVIPAKLALADALTLAVERNPSLAAARSDVDIASAVRLDAPLEYRRDYQAWFQVVDATVGVS